MHADMKKSIDLLSVCIRVHLWRIIILDHTIGGILMLAATQKVDFSPSVPCIPKFSRHTISMLPAWKEWTLEPRLADNPGIAIGLGLGRFPFATLMRGEIMRGDCSNIGFGGHRRGLFGGNRRLYAR
jgi:hypothetical protein